MKTIWIVVWIEAGKMKIHPEPFLTWQEASWCHAGIAAGEKFMLEVKRS